MKAAVIGAGLAGLRVSNLLREMGAEVRVFEKARGPSGRMATRRTEHGQFDHGAQYFTARDASFASQVDDWCRRAVAEPWTGSLVRLEAGRVGVDPGTAPRYVGTPRMSAITRDLATGLACDFETRIVRARRVGGSWTLETDAGVEFVGFDVVLIAVPAPQAVPLLAEHPEFAETTAKVRMWPCHALMLRFRSDLPVEFDAAFVSDSALAWIARNASKPGREAAPTWVLHSSAEWSGSNLDLGAVALRDQLLTALSDAIGQELPAVDYFAAHRWLYARAEGLFSLGALWDRERGLGVCGDWLHGDRVEDAYLSANALAHEIRSR